MRTPEETKRRYRELRSQGYTRRGAMDALGIVCAAPRPTAIVVDCDKCGGSGGHCYGLPPCSGCDGVGKVLLEPSDPTPAEIIRRCEEIQGGWSDRERRQHEPEVAAVEAVMHKMPAFRKQFA